MVGEVRVLGSCQLEGEVPTSIFFCSVCMLGCRIYRCQVSQDWGNTRDPFRMEILTRIEITYSIHEV